MKIEGFLCWLVVPGLIFLFLFGLILVIAAEYSIEKKERKNDSQSLGYYISFAKEEVKKCQN